MRLRSRPSCSWSPSRPHPSGAGRACRCTSAVTAPVRRTGSDRIEGRHPFLPDADAQLCAQRTGGTCMQPLTLTRAEQPIRPRHLAASFAVVALVLVALVPVSRSLADSARRDVTIENPSPWAVHVDLVLDDGRRLDLGPIGPDTTEQLRDVLTPGGSTWTFELDAWGHVATVDVDGDEALRVPVPAELTEALEAAQAPPSP